MHLREYFKQRIYRRQARPLDKYFGKWPFRRVWGVQELMSVLFSMCNLVVRVACAESNCRCSSLGHLLQAGRFGRCCLNPDSKLKTQKTAIPACCSRQCCTAWAWWSRRL